MRRVMLTLAAAVVAAAAGCGDTPPPPTPATDAETIKKLEAEQKQGRGGEK